MVPRNPGHVQAYLTQMIFFKHVVIDKLGQLEAPLRVGAVLSEALVPGNLGQQLSSWGPLALDVRDNKLGHSSVR